MQHHRIPFFVCPRVVLALAAGALLLAACQPGWPTGSGGSPESASATVPDGATCSSTNPDQLFRPGVIQETGVVTNLAIDGLGWFPVREGARRLYSRSGNYFLDDSGHLADAHRLVLQGTSFDASGVPGDGDLTIRRSIAPRSTTQVRLHVNLDASSVAPAAWDAASPRTTSNWSTSQTVYDSLGASHKVDVYFRNTGAGGAWEWHAMADGGELGGTAGIPTQVADGTLTFSNYGSLTDVTTSSSSASFTGAAPNQVLAYDFGSTTSAGGTGFDTTTFAKSFQVMQNEQDGWAAGDLASITIDTDGLVQAAYTNGLHLQAAQVLLARFAQPLQLVALGGHRYAESACSGAAYLDLPGSFALGGLLVGAVEQ